jgi:hypothetical protein
MHMTFMDWLEWLPTVISILMAVSIFIGRNWLKARIERSIQHTFDAKLEILRADLRGAEERIKSDLRMKEAEISVLRDGALSGRAVRQAPVDRRRLEAVERIWTRVSTTLDAYKALARIMGTINFDVAAKRSSTQAGVRQLFESLLAPIPEDDAKTNNMNPEQLFLSPLAWAYFSSYQAILYVAYARAKVLALGIDDPESLFDLKPYREIIKAALPHHSDYIDRQPVAAFHHLLDELEANILKELRSMLEGHETDLSEIERARAITTAVNNVARIESENRAAMVHDEKGA